jgi:hypothetical protein
LSDFQGTRSEYQHLFQFFFHFWVDFDILVLKSRAKVQNNCETTKSETHRIFKKNTFFDINLFDICNRSDTICIKIQKLKNSAPENHKPQSECCTLPTIWKKPMQGLQNPA